MCGYVVIAIGVKADLFKTRLEKHQDEASLIKVIDRIRRGVEEAKRNRENTRLEEDSGAQKKRKQNE